MYFNKNKIKDIEAMIFAAGKGKRMRYMTKYQAKPLIKFNNTSVLETNIKKIANSGIAKIIINSNYMHTTIKRSLKDLSFKMKVPKIILSFEKQLLETGGGFKNNLHEFEKKKILLVNGDSLLVNSKRACPILDLNSNFNERKMDVFLLLAKQINTLGYKGKGDYKKVSNSYSAKLSSKKSNFDTRYIFTGWQIINKDFMKKFTKKKFSLKHVYDLAEKNNRLYGIVHTGLFFHVGDPKAYSIIKSFLGFKKIKIL